MKSIYNPGLGAVVFLHIPVGAVYIRYIVTHGLAAGTDWAAGVIYTILGTVFILGFLTYVVLSDLSTEWVFIQSLIKPDRTVFLNPVDHDMGVPDPAVQ